MSHRSSTDKAFLATLESWLREQSEILVLFRYSHAAGSKDFELFSSFETLAKRLRDLTPNTSVIAFKHRQLPIRGVVDDVLIAKCISVIPDGVEFLVLETSRNTHGNASWFHHSAGDSHAELQEELTDMNGCTVAVGLCPPWHNDSDEVISAVVPDERGAIKLGTY